MIYPRWLSEFASIIPFVFVPKMRIRSHGAKELDEYRILQLELRQLKRGLSTKSSALALFWAFVGIFLGSAQSLIGSDLRLSWRLFFNVLLVSVALVFSVICGLFWKNAKDDLGELFNEIESRPIVPSGDETAGEISGLALDSLPSEPEPKNARPRDAE